VRFINNASSIQKLICLKIGLMCACFIPSVITFSQFRVVGYIPAGRTTAPDVSKVSFQNITHLNIAFVNPDSTGNLILPAGFDTLVQKAHEYKLKVLASIGGGSFNPYYSDLLSDSNRKAFVTALVQLAIDHDLDGIDVDLENDNANDKNYDNLITGLVAGLHPIGKLLTAALATWNGQIISNAALETFDFINVMSYDQTGPWRPDKPGPHSTYAKAKEDLRYWSATRGYPAKKINLGLPFYGYCFGTAYGESMSYADIITTFPGSDQRDELAPATGGMIYYNGIPTIRQKTSLALKSAGGVMIWQLLQDSNDDKSLLTTINEVIKNSSVKN
jgi:chitinase